MSDDEELTEASIYDAPEFDEFDRHVREELLPKLANSAMTVSLVTGGLDAKFAVELGASIMLDKPLVIVVYPGVEIPRKLALVADEIVEGGSLDSEEFNDRLYAAFNRVIEKLEASDA